MMGGNTYIMESDNEGERLELKTDRLLSERLLKLAGVKPGMRVLDAGAGTGAVARVASELVGSEGQVLCLERSPDRLATAMKLSNKIQLENMSFVSGDLYSPPLLKSSFDLVWCRFVLEFVDDPELVLARLIDLVRPGGKIVVSDLDGNGVFNYPMPRIVEEGLERFERLLENRVDPYVGRKLFSLFRKQNLSDIFVHLEPYHLYAGAVPESDMKNWRQKMEVARPHVIDSFPAFDEFAEAYLDFLKDPDTFSYSVLVLVRGVKL